MEALKKIEREHGAASAMWINVCLLLVVVSTPVEAQAPMPVTPSVDREQSLSVSKVDREESKSVSTAPVGQSNGYLIGPDDVLSVYIVDVPELSREYRVDPTGSVTLPILSKPVRARIDADTVLGPALPRTKNGRPGQRSAYNYVSNSIQAACGSDHWIGQSRRFIRFSPTRPCWTCCPRQKV